MADVTPETVTSMLRSTGAPTRRHSLPHPGADIMHNLPDIVDFCRVYLASIPSPSPDADPTNGATTRWAASDQQTGSGGGGVTKARLPAVCLRQVKQPVFSVHGANRSAPIRCLIWLFFGKHAGLNAASYAQSADFILCLPTRRRHHASSLTRCATAAARKTSTTCTEMKEVMYADVGIFRTKPA